MKALPLEDLGYLSPTEFVRDAIREKCDREKTAGPNPRPRRGRKKSVVPILLILGALVLASLASPGARAAYAPAAVEPDPWLAGNVTVRSHMGTYGLYDYSDDAGLRATLLGVTADARIAAPWNVSWSRVYAPGVLQEQAIGTSWWTDPTKWTITFSGSPTCTVAQDSVDGVGKSLRFKAVTSGAATCYWDFTVSPAVSLDLAKTRFLVGVDTLSLTPGNLVSFQAWGSDAKSSTYFISTLSTPGCAADNRNWGLGNAAGSPKTNQTQAETGGVALSTFAPSFNYTRAGNLRIAFQQLATALPDGRWSATYDEANLRASYRFDFGLPAATDLTYSTIALQDELHVPGGGIASATWDGQSVLARYQGKPRGAVLEIAGSVAPGRTSPFTLTVAYSSSDWPGDGGGFFEGPDAIKTFFMWLSIAVVLLVVLWVAWTAYQKRRKARGEKEGEDSDVQTPSGVRRPRRRSR